MSGNQMILLGGSQAPVVDPYFYSVTSLLHGDGTNGGQNNTFLDSSTNNFTITRNGNTTQGSFSPFSQTGWSNYFDGSGDYLTATCNAISGAYTFEAWIYATTATVGNIYSTSGSGGLSIYRNAAGRLGVQTGSSAYIETIEGVLPANTWCHVAVTKNASNTYVMYVNGVSYPAVSTLGTMGSSYSAGTGQVGTAFNISANFTGYISNLRVVNGTQVYTSNFTPPTAPLTAISNTEFLTCQSNRFIDNSSNAFTITRNGDVSVQPFSPFNPITPYSTSAVGGSGYFDGSGDYLTTTGTSSFNGSTGNWTFEAWCYFNNASNNDVLINGIGAGGDRFYILWVASTFYLGDGVQNTIVAGSGKPINQWFHIAVVKNGSTYTAYLNGVSIGTSTTALANTAITTFEICGRTSQSWFTSGYLANFRYSQSAIYTTTFTPPTSLVSGGALLLNFTNGAIFDNAAVADYETVGNAQISTSVKKYGTGSLAFDGSGDRLVGAPIQTRAPGTGDFCYEFWFYANTSSNACLFDTRAVNNNTTGFACLLNGSSQIALYTDTTILTCGLALSASTWYHIAVTRTAGVIKVFVNGTVVGTLANTSNFSDRTLQLGQYIDSTGSLNGYIDDFRSSNGVGRYAYNFTPPTAEFPNIGGTVTLTADPYFDYTTLLLPGNGTNGAQNNTFLDSSTNAFSITRNGNTTQGTFSPFSQTGWGNYFDGTGDYLSVPDAAAFTLGTSDFCMESWVYPVNAGTGASESILGQWSSASYGWIFQYRSNKLLMYYSTNGSSTTNAIDATATIVNNAWNHIAFVRSGNTLSAYVNGVRVSTNASFTASIVNSSSTVNVGRNGDNSEYVTGYLSNTRLVVGSSVYDPTQASFTVPTAPLTAITNTSLLTCQSNRFIDNSTNAFAITRNGDVSVQAFSPFNPTASWSAATNGGSGYFDGSGDYLSVADNAALRMGTGNFTIEFWWYPNSISGFQTLFDKGFTSPGGILFQTGPSAGVLGIYSGTNQSTLITANVAVVANMWTHVALVRNGTSLVLYYNGVSVGSATNSTDFNNTSTLGIGATQSTGNEPINGYLAGLRIVKGTAVYTAAFTPPTSPPTAITNTSLLLNYTNAGIYDATSKNDLETVGNAQISTTQSKFGGSSMYFDGSGDYLLGPWNPPTDLGAGDFTIEFWMYPTAVGQSSVTYLFYLGTSGNYAPILIGQAASGYGIVLYSSSTGSSWNLASGSSFGTATVNAWNHVALTRYGADVRLFLNGVVGTTLNWGTTALLTGSSHKPNIGSATGVANTYYTGYMQDLRVTKGIARYTSNFTPPTSAFLTL